MVARPEVFAVSVDGRLSNVTVDTPDAAGQTTSSAEVIFSREVEP